MNIQRFIDVNIRKELEVSINNVPTSKSTLFIALVDDNAPAKYKSGLVMKNGQQHTFSSSAEVLTATTIVSGSPATFIDDEHEVYHAVVKFFEKGGTQAKIAYVSDSALTNISNVMLASENVINTVVIPTTIVDGSTYDDPTFDFSNAITVANAVNHSTDAVTINDKILHYDMLVSEYDSLILSSDAGDALQTAGLAVHVCPTKVEYVSSIASAYLSTQGITSTKVKEYLYTNIGTTPVSFSDQTEDLIPAVDTYFFNAYMRISSGINAVLGGTCTDGSPLLVRHNTIAAEQDMTTILLRYLFTKKPTFSPTTLTEIDNLLTTYLDKWLDAGWLVSTTSPINKFAVKEGIQYKLLTEGELLEYGYKVVILPYSKTNKMQRQLSDIFVFLSTMMGIVKITLSGEVI